jgi:hypothetical protein
LTKWHFKKLSLSKRHCPKFESNLWRDGVHLDAVDGSGEDERLVNLVVFTQLFPDWK